MRDIERVIQALKRVPEKELAIVKLAWEVLDDAGQLDFQKVIGRQPEVNLAIAEARAYSRATKNAAASLRKIRARGSLPQDEYLGGEEDEFEFDE